MADNPYDVATGTPVDQWITNLVKTIPDLLTVYTSSFDKKTGKALFTADVISQKIQATKWYIENGPTVAANIAARFKYGDNYYNDKVTNYKNIVSSLAANIGLNTSDPAVSAELSALAESSFLHGWDNTMVESKIIANQKLFSNIKGGAYANTVTEIGDYANLYGIKLTDTQRKDYQNRLVGTVDANGIRVRSSADDIKNELRAKAAATYPIFAEQFKAGQSLWDVTSNVRTKMADVLELDPESITWDDPLWKDGKIFQSVDAKTGQIAMRPLYDVDKMLREDERWQYTKNANDTYAKYTGAILSKFGMVAI